MAARKAADVQAAPLPDEPVQSRFYDIGPERTVEQMAARARARQSRRADAQRLYGEEGFPSVDNGSDW